MKCAAVIQARFGSTRLPGKILADVCGKPVLQWLVERVKKSRHINEVFVATSIMKENLPVHELSAKLGVRVFAGSENDVLDRFYQLAKLIQPVHVVRITADCPCYDWNILDRAINEFDSCADYMSDFGETLPDGLDIEIIRFKALETAWKEAVLPSEREHVTPYIRKNPGIFGHKNFICPYGELGHLRLTLDEEADMTLVRRIYEHFCNTGNPYFTTEDVLKLFEEQPELMKLNSHIARNEGYAKSMQNDKRTV